MLSFVSCPSSAQGIFPLGSKASLWKNRAIMSETKNQFSLARAPLSTGGRARTDFPS